MSRFDANQFRETTLAVEGMNCASCVTHVEKAARGVPGVLSASVSLAGGRARVRFDGQQTTADTVAAAIGASGYPAKVATAQAVAGERQQRNPWLNRAVLGTALWLPVECLHWAVGMHHRGHGGGVGWIDYLAAISSTVAIVLVGRAFYRSAWSALRHGTSNMDTLIAIGTTVAWGYSAVALTGFLAGAWHSLPELYFMEASGLLALISIGHALEARARLSAGSAVRALLELAPASAWRLAEDGEARAVDIAELAVGDRILVRPGDRVPIDGVVIDGQSSIDESMITGEALPLPRRKGDAVIGGTQNQDGRLIVRVSKIGGETALAQIIQLVEKAQDSKPPIQQLADRIAAVFVPAVLGIALLTGLAWIGVAIAWHWDAGREWAMVARTACSVLIIACPCALGLAVPASIMVGTGLGARRGILIRDIDAIQQAEKVTVVLLDKTGTVTTGKPAVVEIRPLPPTTAGDLLRLAASAEQFSEHPLASAIVRQARERGINLLDPEQFQNHPGEGVIATIGGRRLIIGNSAMLSGNGMAVPPMDADGRTSVFVAENGVLLGSILLADEPREDSASAIAKLHAMGLRVVMLSGDNRSAAEAIAKRVGIESVKAELKPGDKAAIVESYRREAGPGGAVAMVGDGINDAPALAAADVGIAIGAGSDIAKETAGIVLMNARLSDVAAAIELSRGTMRTIRQNLFFAFIYNVLAIPLAAVGLLNPLIASGAMALSDVTVVGNALRLQSIRMGVVGGKIGTRVGQPTSPPA
jgi:Cu+-exporting ATPase